MIIIFQSTITKFRAVQIKETQVYRRKNITNEKVQQLTRYINLFLSVHGEESCPTKASSGEQPESQPLLLRPAQCCACCELASYPPPGLSLCRPLTRLTVLDFLLPTSQPRVQLRAAQSSRVKNRSEQRSTNNNW